MLLCILGLGGLVLDVGRAYVAKAQLQNSTNAAALAASGQVFSANPQSNATTYADQFSGTAGNSNGFSLVGATVSTSVATKCLNILMPSGETCASNNPQIPNAVQVTQTATLKTYFMPIIFGPSSLSISTAATASYGQAQPWNIAIILDATPSMNSIDGNCGTTVTELQCAMGGIQTMLAAVSPCAPGFSSCATSNADFHIALFSFPGVSTSTVSDDSSNCGAAPNFMDYSLPLPTATSYTPTSYVESGTTWTSTYEIVPFSSDYYSNTTSNHLNSSSALVEAVTGCMTPNRSAGSGDGGLQFPHGAGGITYYAATIYAAQAALLAEQAANPGTRNAIIMLSDGQANILSSTSDFPSQVNSTLASGSLGFTTPGSNGFGIYPDFNDECQQAIKAAQDAATAGTRVYAVSYGSEDQGCSSTVTSSTAAGTDSTVVVTGKNAAFTATSITPCITMENIASSPNYFYSDYNQSGSGVDKSCISSANLVT
ncbi:MAG: pilus assembly protein TadG-related protein, partial [Terracidiphilus sp.]